MDVHKDILTGVYAIDSQTQGLPPGSVTIFAGGAGGFKSTMMIDLCRRIADHGNKVLFISYEMDIQTIQMKLISRALNVDYSSLTNEPLQPALLNAIKSYSNQKTVSLSTASYRDNAIKLFNYLRIRHAANPFNCLLIDSFDMIQAGIEPDEQHHREDMVKRFRMMGHELGFATILTVGVKREVYERARKQNPKFTAGDLKGPATLAWDVDNVFIIWRGESDNHAIDKLPLFMHSVKLRYSEPNKVRRLLVNPERCRIEEAHDAVSEKIVLDQILNG